VVGPEIRSIGSAFVRTVLVAFFVSIATAIIFVFRGVLASVNIVSIVYLLPVLIAALLWGVWPAVLAAIAGAMAADFFFYPPLYSFWISDTQNVADLIVFLAVALVSGELAAGLRRREREINDLYALSKRLAGCFTTVDLLQVTQDYLSQGLGLPVAITEEPGTGADPAQSAGVPETIWRAAVAIPTDDFSTHLIADGRSRRHWLVRRILLGARRYLIFVNLGRRGGGDQARLNQRVDAVITEAFSKFARLDLAKALEDARIQGQADALRNALVASMSHDLRTPLVSILGAASVLDEIAALKADARAQSLVATVHDEAARLDGDIQNLLTAAQITAGLKQTSPQLCDLVDIAHAAIDKKTTQLSAHHLDLSLAPDLPLVDVQSALVENAIAQLIDNAAKYSPPGSTISIAGRREDGWIVLSVSDQGVGLAADEVRHIGQHSFRSARHADSIAGSGLGLWIANAFVTANGGRLQGESAGPGAGSTFRIRLPVGQRAERNR
jgi:K+-sensing histidine kinase KdpD